MKVEYENIVPPLSRILMSYITVKIAKHIKKSQILHFTDRFLF